MAVVVPFVGIGALAWLFWGTGFHWVDLALLVGMYLITGFGITIGFHRLFTHKSFETSRTMKLLLAISGSMALQGPLLQWVAQHRRHHHHSDEHDDPHSPHTHGEGLLGALAGMWHSHVGWLFKPDSPDLPRYVVDLRKDRMLRIVDALFPFWVALGLCIPALVGGLITRSWTGALLGFIWGGLARIFLVHHVTWSINSVCHLWGTRPFNSHDESRNNFIFGVLGLGEGWHNNHHAFPTSARHGLLWWQIDFTYWIIVCMERMGLVSKVRVPSADVIAARRA